MATSTLLTSRRSQADFVGRFIFFALAPFAIVLLAAIFPVTGALINIGLGLGVFIAGEAFRERASGSRLMKLLIGNELRLSLYYTLRPPRPFAYYAFYPLLLPYWLINSDARREFWLFKGYTLGSFIILILSVVYQYFASWAPDLSVLDYARVVGITLVAELFLVIWLLMPIATTVIGFHGTKRRGRLVALLVVGLLSTGIAVARLASRRDPIVSYATRERLYLRTAKNTPRARDAQITAVRAAWRSVVKAPGSLDEDGKVEGPPLDHAREALMKFYKEDEAYAFDLWASPRNDPRVLVLYFEAHRGKPGSWIAMRLGGEEIKNEADLPKGAFAAMRRATR